MLKYSKITVCFNHHLFFSDKSCFYTFLLLQFLFFCNIKLFSLKRENKSCFSASKSSFFQANFFVAYLQTKPIISIFLNNFGNHMTSKFVLFINELILTYNLQILIWLTTVYQMHTSWESDLLVISYQRLCKQQHRLFSF